MLLSTWSIILSNDPRALSWFAFHPTFNTLAVLCFTFGPFFHNSSPRSNLICASRTGILTLQPTSHPETRAAGLKRHQIANIMGVISILVGASAILAYKTSHGARHFTTWHSVRSPYLPRAARLTSIYSLDLWPDHCFLSHRSGCGWRRKCLVWRCRIWRRSKGQAGVEVSQAVRLHSTAFPPDHCSSRRWLVNMGLRTQCLRRPPRRLYSGTCFPPCIHLFSRQVH